MKSWIIWSINILLDQSNTQTGLLHLLVPVLKRDRSVHLCSDYKLTVNKVAKLDNYHLPRIEGLFAKLSGGTKCTTVDPRHTNNQIPLDEESKKYMTVSTMQGLFEYNHLIFGVHCTCHFLTCTGWHTSWHSSCSSLCQ